jgi:hypothetical protein
MQNRFADVQANAGDSGMTRVGLREPSSAMAHMAVQANAAKAIAVSIPPVKKGAAPLDFLPILALCRNGKIVDHLMAPFPAKAGLKRDLTAPDYAQVWAEAHARCEAQPDISEISAPPPLPNVGQMAIEIRTTLGKKLPELTVNYRCADNTEPSKLPVEETGGSLQETALAYFRSADRQCQKKGAAR